MSPIEATNFDINNVKLSLSGIGAVLQFEDGYTRIRSVVPGGPADMSKQIKPNDRIIAVAQGAAEPVDTVDMKLNKVVEMIRGPRNTEVRLTVIPATSVDGSERRIVKIIRDEIKLTEQKAKAVLTERTDAAGVVERWGVVTLPQFYEHCAADVSVLLQRMKKKGSKASSSTCGATAAGCSPRPSISPACSTRKVPSCRSRTSAAAPKSCRTPIPR